MSGGGTPSASADTVGVDEHAVVESDSIGNHLIAHYDFEDSSNVALDVSGKGNNGAAGGKLAQSADSIRGNGAANFDSTNHLNGESYMWVPSTLAASEEMTIMAWLKFDRAAQSEYTPLFFFSNGVNADFELLCNSPRAWWGYEGFYRVPGGNYNFFPTLATKSNTNGPVAGNAVAQSGRWHHVALTFGSGYMKIYVNGHLATQQTVSASPSAIGATVGYIGGDTYGGSSYHGLMDDLRVYDKVLTEAQIADVNDFSPEDFLYVHYTFDDADNIGKDSSGYNNDATVVAGTDGSLITQVEDGGIKAASFNGNAYLSMPYAIVLGNQGMTVNCTIKADTAPEVYTHLIDFCSGINLNDDLAIRFEPGISALGIYGNSPYNYFDTSVSLPLNEWVTVSMTFDETAMKLYLDGALIFEEKNVGYDASDLWNTAFNRIGKSYDWESSFVGLIDDVQIYSKTLSQDELVTTITTKNPYLSDIKVDGEGIVGFSSTRTEYYTIVDNATAAIPSVEVVTVHPETTYVVDAATSIPGTTKIVTHAADGKEITYMIHYLLSTVNYNELKNTRIEDVEINDPFWSEILQKYATVTAKYVLEQYYTTNGNLANYVKIANGERNTGGYVGTNDFYAADYYTVIAGAERLLRQYPDAQLQEQIDGYVDIVCAASESMPDGYFGIYNILNTDGCRFDDPVADVTSRYSGQWTTFDLDQMGALCEAGVEYYLTTGKTNLLRAAVRFAECAAQYSMDSGVSLISVYNFAQLGLNNMYEFFVEHPEVKNDAALAELNIQEERFLLLSQHLIKSHGDKTNRVNNTNYGAYSLDDAKYYAKESPTGAHAGSANCFMTSLIETYRLTGDVSYAQAAYTLGRNVIDKQLYVTGGTGATEVNEAYGGDYVLPNETAYCETCTAGYLMRFCNSMGMVFTDSEFSDVIELEMYNTLLGAVGEDGKTFFYRNAPAAAANRWDWHPVPCCTKMNIMTYGNLASYLYYYSDNAVYVNQYVGSTANIKLSGGTLTLNQTADWANNGSARITLSSGAEHLTTLYLRLPSWSENNTVTINDAPCQYTVLNGYAVVTGSFNNGDCIKILADMTPQIIDADENVTENIGKVYLRRGAMIYCAEGIDNTINRADVVRKVKIATDAEVNVVDKTVSETTVKALQINCVYDNNGTDDPFILTAIPFYTRSYRDLATMRVYFSKHTHSHSSSFDQEGHFDGCICGDKINITPHSFGDWQTVTEATATTDGLEERVCACGTKETRIIPATGSGSSEPSGTTPEQPSGTTPEQPSGSQSGSSGTISEPSDSGDDNVGLIVGLSVGGAAVASAGIATAIIAAKKRKIKK